MDDLRKIEILLVEDSATDAQLIVRALQRQGIARDPLWIKDGVEALDFLFRRGAYVNWSGSAQPKLVLLDLKLPKMDGIQVVARIKDDERTRTIPVVMMSSSAEEVDLRAAYRHCVNSYVVKPVDFAEFSKVIGDVGTYWLSTNKFPTVQPGQEA